MHQKNSTKSSLNYLLRGRVTNGRATYRSEPLEATTLRCDYPWRPQPTQPIRKVWRHDEKVHFTHQLHPRIHRNAADDILRMLRSGEYLPESEDTNEAKSTSIKDDYRICGWKQLGKERPILSLQVVRVWGTISRTMSVSCFRTR
jgi:hypothetical protein